MTVVHCPYQLDALETARFLLELNAALSDYEVSIDFSLRFRLSIWNSYRYWDKGLCESTKGTGFKVNNRNRPQFALWRSIIFKIF